MMYNNNNNNNNMNMIKCKVDNHWYWSLETAYITVYSPKGGHVRIDKRKLDKVTNEQCTMIWDIYGRITNNGNVEVSVSEMNELVNMGKVAGDVYFKRK